MVVTKKPEWIRVKGVDESVLDKMKALVEKYHLHTVCESATCPNMGECFCAGTATFMILGDICTRNCRFCSVKHGKPLTPDAQEPVNLARAAEELGLKHVVVTSVTRDDLDDGGAHQFADTVRTINRILPGATTDLLIPDLRGSRENLSIVTEARPDILAHNLETVPRLYGACRPQADYRTSLTVLERSKELNPDIHTKSGIMVGLGETRDEVIALMKDLRGAGCDFMTIGQYLRPSTENIEVNEFITPAMFDEYRRIGESLGFSYVASSPFVRSSFHAEEALKHLS